MNDRIDKQDSIVSRIIDGSVTIDSVAKFEEILDVFPNNPELLRVFADLLKRKKSFEAAADVYGTAAGLFIETGMALQAIASKMLEWQFLKPSDEDKQNFYSSLRESKSRKRSAQDFFMKMTYSEMIAFMTEMILQHFPHNSMVKRFGEDEDHLYFVVSGALEETVFFRLEKGRGVQQKSIKNLMENDFFGEIYPFEKEEVSQSNVKTITRVELAKISKSSLMAIHSKYTNIEILLKNLYETRMMSGDETSSRTVRKTVRHQLPTQVGLKIYRDKPGKEPLVLSGFAENISLGGACIVLSKKYEIGPSDKLIGKNAKIQIDLPTTQATLSILGTIVWSKDVLLEEKMTVAVGIQFKEMTDKDRQLLEDCLYGSEGEQNLFWSLWDSLMEK